jgi:hypothetical protein
MSWVRFWLFTVAVASSPSATELCHSRDAMRKKGHHRWIVSLRLGLDLVASVRLINCSH